MIVDQSPEGLEVLRGASTYTFDGNWKLQRRERRRRLPRLVGALELRRHHQPPQGADGKVDTVRAMNAGDWAKQGGGFYAFKHGHLLLWTNWANPEDRPNLRSATNGSSSSARRAPTGCWAQSRNLCLYPNVYLMDQFSSQIRVVRPISVNKTEVTIYCIAPKGEAPEARDAAPAPVRGLLQRHRHGHARRPGGVPRLPARLRRARREAGTT